MRIGITITGDPGSGSTTASQNLAARLNWGKVYYSGGVVRWLLHQIEKHGLESVLALTSEEVASAFKEGEVPLRPDIALEYARFDHALDHLVDQSQKSFLELMDVGVHEGRVAWHFAKELHFEQRASDKIFIHIYCTVDPEEGARRQQHRAENQGKSTKQITEETRLRVAAERQRYKKLYGIGDHTDSAHFHIVLDTTNLQKEGVVSELLQRIEELKPGILAPYLV